MSDYPVNQFTLRPTEKADLEIISRWFLDVADLACFDRTSRIPLNQVQTERLWNDAVCARSDNRNCWFTIETENKDAVGLTGLDAISHVNRDAVIPLFVDRSVRRCGVGIRATALLLDFAFRQLGLNRVTSYYRADNRASQDLFGQLSFQTEGTLRQAWFADGCFYDMIVVGILRKDWMDRRQALAKELKPNTVVGFCSSEASGWSWPPRRLSEG
ncbi:GNAT family N-acetyltransferase [Rhodobacteraceae bacterium B1Z28]|uniref:GNAT family N-acetyltransferase n=1 Tax=Ruegeria haliotis TaxID=2747601 RepID=A0ABX2PRF3_9RHOB|nr:GNAT family N-acetyltransferase [Ruegeria haliotis]